MGELVAARRLQISEIMPFLPEGSEAPPAGRLDLRLPKAARQRLHVRPRIPVSEWALKYRRVALGANVGAWRPELCPQAARVADTFGLPSVREIWYCAAEQSGKTNTMINCLGYAIDTAPANIYYLMPTDRSADKIIGQNLIPTLRNSPALARYLSSRADDTALTGITLNNGVLILPAYANSPVSMASFPARYIFADEVDKYPALAGREADPVSLIKKRTRQYGGYQKLFFVSTPAGQFIWRGMLACDQVFRWESRCPDCGAFVWPGAEQLAFPDGLSPQELETCRDVALACPDCGSLWDEAARRAAISAGDWVATKGGDIAAPRSVGFHQRAFDCLDVPLTEIAAAFARAKTGDHGARIAWANGYLAEDYVAESVERHEDMILALRDDRPSGAVPANVAALTMAVDTQLRGFWYEIRAWGYGLERASWQVRHGYVETFSALAQIAEIDVYTDPAGQQHHIAIALIDSGGGVSASSASSRTVEVYDFCRAHPLFRPIKGRARQQSPWTASHLDRYPDGRAMAGGLALYNLNVTHYKDALARKLSIAPSDPGAWLLSADCDLAYARQMCAEVRNEHGLWECLPNRANHYWDVAVYQLAAADIAGIAFWQPPGAETSAPRPQIARAARENQRVSRW